MAGGETDLYSFLVTRVQDDTNNVKHVLRSDGQVLADANYTSGGADFAEWMEWSDGNSSNEDRVGMSVSLVTNSNGKPTIKVAESGEAPIGVISARPTAVGNSDWNGWQSKYTMDSYGRYVLGDVTYVSWTDSAGEYHSYPLGFVPSAVTVPSDAAQNTVVSRLINSDYNPNLTHETREDRKEWDTVGLTGIAVIRTGQEVDARWVNMGACGTGVSRWLIR